MNNFAERLLSFIKYLGLNNTRFADEINVQRSGISHILSGRNKPGLDFITKILDTYPELNPDWIIMGRGEMLKSSVTKETLSADSIPSDKETPGLNDQIAIPFSEKPPAVEEKEIVKSAKNIEKIVIFYTDDTFRTYSPDQ